MRPLNIVVNYQNGDSLRGFHLIRLLSIVELGVPKLSAHGSFLSQKSPTLADDPRSFTWLCRFLCDVGTMSLEETASNAVNFLRSSSITHRSAWLSKVLC